MNNERIQHIQCLLCSQDAAEGVIEYTAEVEEMYQCLRQNRVPQAVVAASYPMAFGLAAWMANLRRRVDFMAMWLRGQPPQPFWLPGCFSPRSVCTAMLQQYARRQSLKIDSVGFTFCVLDDEEDAAASNAPANEQQKGGESAPNFAHDVSGLFLHGASWSPEEKVRVLLNSGACVKRLCTSLCSANILIALHSFSSRHQCIHMMTPFFVRAVRVAFIN